MIFRALYKMATISDTQFTKDIDTALHFLSN